MTIVLNKDLKRKRERSHRSHSLATALLSMLLLTSTLLVLAHTSTKSLWADTSFSFTAAGDYAKTTHTTANLNAIAKSGASFHLALGDFSYATSVTPAAWSTYVKSHLPT